VDAAAKEAVRGERNWASQNKTTYSLIITYLFWHGECEVAGQIGNKTIFDMEGSMG
jgi:hypothetical protein